MYYADMSSAYLQNAHKNLRDAQDDLGRERISTAVSTAYFAAFYAANAALLRSGTQPETHTEIIHQVGKEMVARSDFPAPVAGLLPALRTARGLSEYDMKYRSEVTTEVAERLLEQAAVFVNETERWILRHYPTSSTHPTT